MSKATKKGIGAMLTLVAIAVVLILVQNPQPPHVMTAKEQERADCLQRMRRLAIMNTAEKSWRSFTDDEERHFNLWCGIEGH
jgi:hypothetical protein